MNMPFRYQYFADINCLYTVGTGKVAAKDFLKYHRTLKIDAAGRTLCILADYRDLDPSGLSTDDIEQIRMSALGRMAGRFDALKEAIVVSGSLAYGLSRMFDGVIYSENYEMNVFTDIGEAKAWLGLEPDHRLGFTTDKTVAS